jgi:ABC-type sugar transport system ATPase subunit
MTAILAFRSVSKSFGSTQALSEVDFDVQLGEVHALLGENGAGKSTALGLIYGVIAPDVGEILINGSPVRFRDPAAARRAGIGCVFQELSLAAGISVAENIFAGHPPERVGLIDRAAMRKGAAEMLASLGISIDVDRPVGQLPVSLQQIVEIAKALTSGSRILLLDEPTSALAPAEVDALRRLIRQLKARGIGMVYVSHHIHEVFEIADRITVLRDGRRISTRARADTNPAEVIADMMGKTLAAEQRREPAPAGPPILSANGLRFDGRSSPPLNLMLHGGQITALAGLMGSGTREIAAALAGLTVVSAGTLSVDGRALPPGRAAAARRAGIWFVPEERKADGLFLDFSVMDNLTTATLRRFARGGLMQREAQRLAAMAAITRFRIKAQSEASRVAKLSGGNQQKVMLSRWLDATPRVLIVNEPTKGVDVGAKAQIHELLAQSAAGGAAVLLVSSDFGEILGLADRILLVRNGAIAREIDRNVSVDQLVAAAATTTPDGQAAA